MVKFDFKFQFGRKKRTFYDWVKLGAALNFSIDTLSLLPWVDRKKVFNLIDEVQLRGDNDFLNEYIIKDKELLSFRLERELNKAIGDYDGKD